jgi:glycosyltransferase involved in cell wall biosynthesis
VGFDIDGFLWRRSLRASATRYVVALKGVAADEARFAVAAGERGLLTFLAAMEGRNARSADRVIVPSAYSAGVASRAYGLPEGVIRIVPEPIDLSVWEGLRPCGGRGHDRPTILSVARQYPRKDTATLLRSLRLVRDVVPGAHLRIVGGGPELPRLRALCRELGLGASVTFDGPLADDRDIRMAFLEASLFCLPSQQEGFGIVFLEAMAAGLPVVAARAGAVPEVVVDGETGLLVPPGNPRVLATAVVRLLRDAEARTRMAAEALLRARRYDLARVAPEFLEAAGVRGADSTRTVGMGVPV